MNLDFVRIGIPFYLIRFSASNGRCAVDREFVDIIGTLGGFGENQGGHRGTREDHVEILGGPWGALGGTRGDHGKSPWRPLGPKMDQCVPTITFSQQDLRFWSS